jgi:Putative metal-binding motif
LKNKLGPELIGNRTALILSLLALSAFSFHLENDILAASYPFIFFDPFEQSSSSRLPAGLEEICNDGQDNNRDGLVDENCGSESMTKIVEDNAPIGTHLPESEICNDGQDNNGDGLVDENCGSESITKIVEDSVISHQNASIGTPLPESEICNDGQDNNGDGLVDENCSNSQTSKESDNNHPPAMPQKDPDKSGIREIYPTKPNGEEWFIRPSHPEKDPRFSPQTGLIPNSDGSFKIKSTKVRMGVFTSSGYKPNLIQTLDHSKIAAKGYMQSPNDWRDVEITGYVKLNSGSGDNFAWYARGGRHTGFGSPEGCEGVAYKGDLYFDGQTRWTKEQWHTGGYVFSDYLKGMDSVKGKWVGFKSIMYNIDHSGKAGVKLEIWLDKENTNQWIKVNERVDTGGWGNNGRECGGTPDQIITWGGPIASFRWDSASDVDIRDFSVREIAPT